MEQKHVGFSSIQRMCEESRLPGGNPGAGQRAVSQLEGGTHGARSSVGETGGALTETRVTCPCETVTYALGSSRARGRGEGRWVGQGWPR